MRRSEDDGGSGVEEGVGGGDGGLEILGEASVPADPCQAALNHPAAGMNGEADLALLMARPHGTILWPAVGRAAR